MSESGSNLEAFESVKVRASKGCPSAQFEVGLMLVRGEGVSQDCAEAAKWFRKAAEQGNVDAQGALGLLYSKGEGVNIDHKEAARWYRAAAEQGDVDAQTNLSNMYEEGKGVAQDLEEASRWRTKAAERSKANTPEQFSANHSVPILFANTDKHNELFEDLPEELNETLNDPTLDAAIELFGDVAKLGDPMPASQMPWSRLNETVVCSVIAKLPEIESSGVSELSSHMVELIALSSSTFADFLLSPEQQSAPIVDLNEASVSPHQLLRLHRSVIWTLATLHWKNFESLKSSLATACAQAVGVPDSKLEEARLDFIETSDDIIAISAHLFRHIRRILYLDHNDVDPETQFKFSALFGSIYATLAEDLAAIRPSAETKEQSTTAPYLISIANKIRNMGSDDKAFATAIFNSAQKILDKLTDHAGAFFAQPSRLSMQTYKLLFCHHCMLLFHHDAVAKSAMRRMITDLTDGDYSSTEDLCAELERACTNTEDSEVPIAITTALCDKLNDMISLSKTDWPIAVLVVLSLFEEAKSKIKQLFN